MTLLRWLTFLLGSLTGFHSPALLDIFLSSDNSICSTTAFPLLGNSDHVVVSVSIDFPTNSKWDAPFHRIAYDHSCADWDGLCDHLRDVVIVHRNHFFHLYQQNKFSVSKVMFGQASNCCKRVLEAAKLVYATKTKECISSKNFGSQEF